MPPIFFGMIWKLCMFTAHINDRFRRRLAPSVLNSFGIMNFINDGSPLNTGRLLQNGRVTFGIATLSRMTLGIRTRLTWMTRGFRRRILSKNTQHYGIHQNGPQQMDTLRNNTSRIVNLQISTQMNNTQQKFSAKWHSPEWHSADRGSALWPSAECCH